jgi:hypothetical protein
MTGNTTREFRMCLRKKPYTRKAAEERAKRTPGMSIYRCEYTWSTDGRTGHHWHVTHAPKSNGNEPRALVAKLLGS